MATDPAGIWLKLPEREDWCSQELTLKILKEKIDAHKNLRWRYRKRIPMLTLNFYGEIQPVLTYNFCCWTRGPWMVTIGVSLHILRFESFTGVRGTTSPAHKSTSPCSRIREGCIGNPIPPSLPGPHTLSNLLLNWWHWKGAYNDACGCCPHWRVMPNLKTLRQVTDAKI